MIVLGELNKHPTYGYELCKAIKDKGIHSHSGIKMPSVYKSLSKLEKKEYITGKRIEGDKNPSRTVYQLSDSGYLYFADLVKKSIITYRKTRNEFWIALNYIDNIISKEEFIHILRERISNIKNELEKIMGKLLGAEKLPLQIEYMVKMSTKSKESEIEVLQEMLESITNNADSSTITFKK